MHDCTPLLLEARIAGPKSQAEFCPGVGPQVSDFDRSNGASGSDLSQDAEFGLPGRSPTDSFGLKPGRARLLQRPPNEDAWNTSPPDAPCPPTLVPVGAGDNP